MKLSELKQMIKEEVEKILKENALSTREKFDILNHLGEIYNMRGEKMESKLSEIIGACMVHYKTYHVKNQLLLKHIYESFPKLRKYEKELKEIIPLFIEPEDYTNKFEFKPGWNK